MRVQNWTRTTKRTALANQQVLSGEEVGELYWPEIAN